MGRTEFGIPLRLVESLPTAYGVRVGVETGTFRGDSTVVLARRLDRVVSCEPEADCLRVAQRTVHAAGCADRVRLVHGDSAVCLPEILAGVDEPALFWLDAHWSPWMPVGPRPQCPVLAELDAIARWPHARRSVVMVDDASLYRSRPDDPRHRSAEWPDVQDVAAALADVTGGDVYEVDDVLVGLPARRVDGRSGPVPVPGAVAVRTVRHAG